MENKEQALQQIEDLKQQKQEIKKQKNKQIREERSKFKEKKKELRNQKRQEVDDIQEQVDNQKPEQLLNLENELDSTKKLYKETKNTAKETMEDMIHEMIVNAVKTTQQSVTCGESISVREDGVHKYKERRNSKITGRYLIGKKNSTFKSYHQKIRSLLKKEASKEDRFAVLQAMELAKNIETPNSSYTFGSDEDKKYDLKSKTPGHYVAAEVNPNFETVKFSKTNSTYRAETKVTPSNEIEKIKQNIEHLEPAMEYLEFVKNDLQQKHSQNQEIKDKIETYYKQVEN